MNITKKVSNTLSLLFIAILLLTTVAGCKKDDNNNPPDAVNVSSQDDYIYIAKPIVLPEGISYVSDFAYHNGKIYIATSRNETVSEDNPYINAYIAGFYSADTSSLEFIPLPGYEHPHKLPEGAGGSNSIIAFSFDNDGDIWLLEGRSFHEFDLPGNFNEDNDNINDYIVVKDFGTTLRKISQTGEELKRTDIPGIPLLQEPNSGYVNAFIVTHDPNTGEEIFIVFYVIYETYTPVIYVLDSSGNVLFQQDADIEPYYFNNFIFIHMPGGDIAYPKVNIIDNRISGVRLQGIDIQKKSPLNEIVLPDIGATLYPGGGGYDFLFDDNGRIYGYDLTGNEAVKLFSWIDCSITGENLSGIVMTDDGHFICKKYIPDMESSRYEFYFLERMPRSQAPEKTAITLATIYYDDTFLPEVIKKFNNANPDYIIEIRDYSEYTDDMSRNNLITMLNTDIYAGNIPDIIYLDAFMPYADYVNAGLFADLYEMIDIDPELSRESFVDGVFQAAETNGRLYQVFPFFGIQTMFSDKSVAGNSVQDNDSMANLNIEELKAVLNAHPEADMPVGRGGKYTFLWKYLLMYPDKFIDWNTGTANFNSPEFINLLEISDEISPSLFYDFDFELSNQELAAAGRTIILDDRIGNFCDYYMLQELYGWKIAFIGYPGSTGSVHRFEPVHPRFAITEQSQSKEAAWSFVRTYLTKEWQTAVLCDHRYNAFPANKDAFDDARTISINQRIEMIKIEMIELSSEMTEADLALTLEMLEAGADIIVKLIGESSGAYDIIGFDTVLMDLIAEEAINYFNGLYSAETAALQIQNKASLYLSERN